MQLTVYYDPLLHASQLRHQRGLTSQAERVKRATLAHKMCRERDKKNSRLLDEAIKRARTQNMRTRVSASISAIDLPYPGYVVQGSGGFEKPDVLPSWIAPSLQKQAEQQTYLHAKKKNFNERRRKAAASLQEIAAVGSVLFACCC